MATQWQTFLIEFKGGLISNLSPLQQGANAVGSATILQNFEVNKEGGYTKIGGYEKYSDSVVPGSGPVLGVKVADVDRVYAARKNALNLTEWYYSTGGAWSSLAVSPASNGGKVRHTTSNLGNSNKTLFVDGGNFPAILDHSTNTITYMTSANSPDIIGSSHVAFSSNAAWFAKDSNLYFTAPLTVDDFSSANGAGVINVSGEITGLAVFRENLIVFTENSIKRITGTTTSDFRVDSITDRIGCINGDTIQEVGGDIMYLAPDGIRLLSATDRIGDFGLDIASDTISKDANKMLASTSNFCSILFREKAQYRIFAYIESEQKEAAKGLIATKLAPQGSSDIQWSTTKGIKAFVADSIYAGTRELSLFANTEGYVYTLDTGSSFDGEAIDAIYESPYLFLTDPQVRKTFYKLTLYAEPKGNMDLGLNMKFDFGSPSNLGAVQPSTQTISSRGNSVFFFGDSNATFNAATYGGNLDSRYDVNLVGSAKTTALRIEDNSTNPKFTLDTALLEFAQNDRQ